MTSNAISALMLAVAIAAIVGGIVAVLSYPETSQTADNTETIENIDTNLTELRSETAAAYDTLDGLAGSLEQVNSQLSEMSTTGSMDESMANNMAESIAKSLAENMAEHMDKRMGEKMTESMDEHMGEKMTESMDESMAEKMDESMAEPAMMAGPPPGDPVQFILNFPLDQHPLPLPPFDMDNGNAIYEVVIPYLGSWIHQEVTPHFGDPALAFRYVTIILNSGFDATAPYHESAVGVYSRIDRLPASESETFYNHNVATIYAVYRDALAFDPQYTERWRSMMTSVGLDPDDNTGLDLDCSQQQSLDSPVAIGNFAGKCVLDGRWHDGFNQSGEDTPSGVPFQDSTNYAPVNTPKELVDPSRWQPLVQSIRDGKFAAQQYITPQWANTELYSDLDPRSVRAPAPVASNHENAEAYKAQADSVLERSSQLTDEQKMKAEFFDNKARETLFFPAVEIYPSVMEFLQVDFLVHMAEFDAGVLVWQEKTRYDAVRPVTAIHHLYGDEPVPTWGKGGSGSEMIPAGFWQSYMPTSDHPEYPSATACFCSARADAWRLFTGSDIISDVTLPNGETAPGYVGVRPAGSSVMEPGITPVNDVTIKFDSWTQYEEECADSRVYSGVHFRDAVDASLEMCGVAGETAYEYWTTLMDGTAPLRDPSQPQSLDPMLDEPHFTGR